MKIGNLSKRQRKENLTNTNNKNGKAEHRMEFSGKDNAENNADSESHSIAPQMIINDLETIGEFLHEKKRQILNLLIQREYTIKELSTEMQLNPGTIKRHVDSLLRHKLIKQTRIIQNEWGIYLKYYRAVAERYLIDYSFPQKS